MGARRAVLLLLAGLLGAGLVSSLPRAARAQEEDEEEAELRERLTEREDKRRPAVPWSVPVAGRPLTVGGEYELELAWVRRPFGEDGGDPDDRLFLEHGLEIETFYSFGEPLSIFAQVKVAMEEDLVSGRFDEISDAYLERGEMWLYSENIAGSHVSVDVGHLDFEDDRRWWWDDELDALRVAYERSSWDVELAVARELFGDRTDESGVEPDDEGVLRVLGEASWEWFPNHALEGFLLYQDDRSGSPGPGEVVSDEREDDSDARLLWLGARWMGAFQLRSRGIVGYWLDTAWVSGDEEILELEELSRRRSEVDEVSRRDVRGWAFDAGVNWILPHALEPRLFAGYALGSGDPSPDSGSDRSFRQSGIEDNEAGFGGVERFNHYGVLLDPELSNLQVATVGVGISLLRSSSLDLVYHHYRQVEASTSLPEARLESELTGEDRDLGQEIDLVLALEEWERLEFAGIATAFRAGSAFGRERGSWSYGAFFAVRVAF